MGNRKKHAKSKNWAANLERMTKPAKRLPAIQARAITVTPFKRSPPQCRRCLQGGHNVRTCTNPKAAASKRHVAPPTILHKIVVDRRAVAVRPLAGGQNVLHVAYDQRALTLHVAFKGQFKVHWYAYANVPPRAYERLLHAKNPDAVVATDIDPKYTKTYVHRRKPLPKATR